MANKPMKTINFGGEDTYYLNPDFENIDNSPFETIGGDTLTWDGNTDGRDIVDDMFCHISDVVVTVSDCANGVIATFADGSIQSGTATEPAPGLLMLADVESVLCVATDNYAFNGVIFPKKGIYVTYGDYCVTSLTIKGYTGFTITKLKSEYLPDGGGGSSEFIVNIARGLDSDTMKETVSLDKTYDEIMANLDSAVLIEEIGGGRKFIYRFASKERYPDTQELYPVFHGYTSNLWDKSEKCKIWHRFIRVNADNTVNLISVLIKDFATS